MKNAVTFVFAFGCVGLLNYFSPVLGQSLSNLTNANTNLTATIDKFGFGADVIYESPSTVILTGKTDYSTDLWKALDIVKGLGYKIDAVAQVTESNPVGNTRYLSPVYTIFLSK